MLSLALAKFFPEIILNHSVVLGRLWDGSLTFLGVTHTFLPHERGLRQRKGWGWVFKKGYGLLTVLNIFAIEKGLREGSQEAGGGSFGRAINHFLTFFHHFKKDEKTFRLQASSARVFLVLLKRALLLIHFWDPKPQAVPWFTNPQKFFP